tara:strand:- start:109 stop:669 length:561 start_codon:yes stop_codon:yes gene_type:complete
MNKFSSNFYEKRSTLLKLLRDKAYKRGDFTLSSGKKSIHYLNCKPVSLNGQGLLCISHLLLELMDPKAKAVAGLTLGADPLVSGVVVTAANMGIPLDAMIIRKEIKNYGTKSGIEGPHLKNHTLVTVLEDVVTTAGSSLKAINKLRENNFVVKEVLAIVDRDEGGKDNLRNNDIELKSLFTMRDFI